MRTSTASLRFRPRLPRSRAFAWLLPRTTAVYVAAAALLTGLSGTSVVVVLMSAARRPDRVLVPAILFVVFLAIFRWARRATLEAGLVAVQASLHRTRTRIARKVARLDLREMEGVPREDLLSATQQAYQTISDAAMWVLVGLQSVALLALVLAYVAWLSPLAFLLSLVIAALVIRTYVGHRLVLKEAYRKAIAAERLLLGTVGEALDGFKELRLDSAKRQGVLADFRESSKASAVERVRIASIFTEQYVLAGSLQYFIAAGVVFLLPVFGSLPYEDIPGMLGIALFLLHPLHSILQAVPEMTSIQFAAESIRDFEDRIDRLLGAEAPTVVEPEIREIELQGITYEHRAPQGQPAFRVGPLDFRIKPGEIVFITGRNGGGKTTGLRLLTGLYPPEGGRILLNGSVVTTEDLEAYRHLFGTVFADFHVFRKLYALPPERLPILRDALEQMQLTDKLPADLSKGYDPTALSTGQRKRLALAIAIAEDRPVLVFDEWAADQDPEFRGSFYRDILPALRHAGKAIVAVVHDDRYFDTADRRYHMADRRMAMVSGS